MVRAATTAEPYVGKYLNQVIDHSLAVEEVLPPADAADPALCAARGEPRGTSGGVSRQEARGAIPSCALAGARPLRCGRHKTAASSAHPRSGTASWPCCRLEGQRGKGRRGVGARPLVPCTKHSTLAWAKQLPSSRPPGGCQPSRARRGAAPAHARARSPRPLPAHGRVPPRRRARTEEVALEAAVAPEPHAAAAAGLRHRLPRGAQRALHLGDLRRVGT